MLRHGMSLSTLYHTVIYVGSMTLFGVLGLLVNAISLSVSWLPARPGIELFFQRLIQRHVSFFLRWLAFARVVTVDYRGFERIPRGPVMLVANHPGLLDALYLLARVPHGFCIFKRAIRRNPVLGAAAARAGYIGNDSGIGLVRNATKKIGAGSTLIVFPEGTRTPAGATIGPLRPGFASIARRAGARVQLVRIASDGELLGKGSVWWRVPRLPARVVVQIGPSLDPHAVGSAAELVREVEAWFRGGTLAGIGTVREPAAAIANSPSLAAL
jgi:1-acyl-sn-glycerol-3-phosphate acyltransferase